MVIVTTALAIALLAMSLYAFSLERRVKRQAKTIGEYVSLLATVHDKVMTPGTAMEIRKMIQEQVTRKLP